MFENYDDVEITTESKDCMMRFLRSVLYFVSTVTGFASMKSIDFKNTQSIWEKRMYFNCFLLTFFFLFVFNAEWLIDTGILH